MADIPATRIAIIGCGPRGRGHFNAIEKLDGAECIGVCDLDAERREKFGAETGVRTFEKVDDILAESPDVVAVVTNVETHVPVGCQALEADAHLVMEKPLSTSVKEGRQLLDVAEEKGLKGAVSFQLHYDPFCSQVKNVCEEIEPLLVHHSRHSGLMRPQFLRPGKLTGVFDYLVHEMDLIRWWTQREVVAVTARIGFGVYSDTGATDLAALHLDLSGDNAAAATLVGSMAGKPLGRRIQIAGRKGSIEAQRGGEILRGHGPHVEPEEVPIPQATMDGTAALFKDLVLAGHGESVPNMPTLHDGLAAVAVVEAAFESNETGQRIATGLG